MSRASNLADDVESELNCIDSVSVLGDEELYVRTWCDDPRGMDSVCAIAYDHEFVPCGITDTGAARFKPRDADEVSA